MSAFAEQSQEARAGEPVAARKRLAFVIVGRNDAYIGDFKYRLTTSINYLARNLARIGRLADSEIIVVDWNSDSPLHEAIVLTPAAAEATRFIRVPPEIAAARMPPDRVFHAPLACNVAVRRARSDFVLYMPADVLWPEVSLANLFDILDGRFGFPFDPNACFMVAGRKRIPWHVVRRRPGLDEWDRFLALTGSEIDRDPEYLPGLGACSCILMMSARLWEEAHGCDERLAAWGWSDIELTLRLSQRYPLIDLLGLGVAGFDMDPADEATRQRQRAEENPRVIHAEFSVNDEDWGLGRVELPEHSAARVAAASRHEASTLSPPASLSELTEEIAGDAVRLHLLASMERWWDIPPADWPRIWAVAWHCLRMAPRRYLQFGFHTGYVTAVVGHALPCVEIYAADPWRNREHTIVPCPLSPSALLKSRGYRGYIRLVTGDPGTALERLKDSLGEPFAFDLALVQGEFFGADSERQLRLLMSGLAPGGAIVFACRDEDLFESVWSQLQSERDRFGLTACCNAPTGLILAGAFTGSHVLRADLTKPPRASLSAEAARAAAALTRVHRYPVYLQRLARRVRHVLTARRR